MPDGRRGRAKVVGEFPLTRSPDGDDLGRPPRAVAHKPSAHLGAGVTDDAEAETATLMDSYTEMTELLLPNDTNNLGRALGGVVLHWMDLCGAVAAMRFSSRQCVTAAMDHVDFIAPIDRGEVAIVEAYVFDTGRTSVDVKVDVRAEDPREGDSRETTSSFFTFVALDEAGTPTAVPDLDCPTQNQRALRDHAHEQRREQVRAVAERYE
jgi:acyl-CoA hydrolase